MSQKQFYTIEGKKDGVRIESRIMEENIQKAISHGYRDLIINAVGQHGIGGRLWKAKEEKVYIRVEGYPGQRVGSMGFPNTYIELLGPASDDVGWLNAGAEIIVHGNAGNGAANAMAQGKIYVGGNIGARGMTMTKYNPRFLPPELWVLGSVGDYFGEFMAGGVAVVCGFNAQSPDNVLGYRPLVGMVGGKVFFRGPHQGFSQTDAKMMPISDEDWAWLTGGIETFLDRIDRTDLFDKLTNRKEWQLLTSRSPHEKASKRKRSMHDFRKDVWDADLGRGGLIGDLSDIDRSLIPLITSGNLRRYVPVWENKKYLAPCQASCPTGIPVQERWRLIREGRVDEAIDLALAYTPFPATVCGYLCPNLCMQGCTRHSANMNPVDVTKLGQASLNAKLPKLPKMGDKKIAVIGGGPAGISVAWQLLQKGYQAVLFDRKKTIGGKISSVIPNTRVPKEVVSKELERVKKSIPKINYQQDLTKADFEQLKTDYDFIVIATGAQKPIILPIPGNELAMVANDFLVKAKSGKVKPGKKVVIIGAGNVGCDVATEAHRLGAKDITLIDIQEPASFGKERKEAEAAGAKFKWPCFTKEITKKGVVLTTGELLAADTVVFSIGDRPEIEFLPEEVKTQRGYIVVNEYFQTDDPKIFAIGDTVKPGLLTDAIGAGRKAADAIKDILDGKRPKLMQSPVIDKERVTLEYFDPRIIQFEDMNQCGAQCSSCGACRDCGICVAICPQTAISRNEVDKDGYEYVVDADRCIGCGFCAGACPCGIWNLVENEPMN